MSTADAAPSSAPASSPEAANHLSKALVEVISEIRKAFSSVPIPDPVESAWGGVSGSYYDTADTVARHNEDAAIAESDVASLQETAIERLQTFAKSLFKDIYCSATCKLDTAAGTAATSDIVDNLPGCDLLEILCAVAWRGVVVPVEGNKGDGGIDVAVPKAGPLSTHFIQCKLGPSHKKSTRKTLLALVGTAVTKDLSKGGRRVEKVTLVQTPFTPQPAIIANAKINMDLEVEMVDIATVETLLQNRIDGFVKRWTEWEDHERKFLADFIHDNPVDFHDEETLVDDLDPAALQESLYRDVFDICKKEISIFSNAVAAAGLRLRCAKAEVKTLLANLDAILDAMTNLDDRIRIVQKAGWASSEAARETQRAFDEDNAMKPWEKAFMDSHFRDESSGADSDEAEVSSGASDSDD